MFRVLEKLTYCTLFSHLVLMGNGDSLLPLTEAEADAIIQQRESSQQIAKAARIAELEEATVKSEGRGVLPNGQNVIIREIEPPSVGAQLVEAATEVKLVEPLSPTPEQIAQLKLFAEKEHHTLMLSATVYDRSVTRLSWRHLSGEFIAYTNADFSYLRGTHSLDVDNASFTFFMGIGNASYANNPYSDEIVPDVSTFSSDRSEYVLMQGDPDNAEALAGLEALLAHYDTNLEDLKVAHQRREALTAAQERYNAKHLKEPEDCIMQFWVPKPTDRKVGE